MPHLILAQALDNSGDPLASGKVYTYLGGTTTATSSYPTYDDAVAGTNANANPTVLDSAGRAQVWVPDFAVKMKIDTSADVTLDTIDDIYGGGAGSTTIINNDNTVDYTILADNDANAIVFKESSNNYLRFDTTNASEALHFGNATQNTAFNFLGTGTINIATATITLSNGAASTITATNGVVLTSDEGAVTLSTTGSSDITLSSADDIHLTAGSDVIITASNDDVNIISGNDVDIDVATNFEVNTTSGDISLVSGSGRRINLTTQGAANGTSPDINITSTADLDINVANNIELDTTNGAITLTAAGATAGDITLSAEDDIAVTTSNGNITFTATSGDIIFNSEIYIKEQSGEAGNVTSHGQIWVRSSDDALMYTTEAGTSYTVDLTAV